MPSAALASVVGVPLTRYMPAMRILVADALAQRHLAPLSALGEVDYRPDLPVAALGEALPGASVLVVRGKKVSAAAIEAGRDLGLIVRAGAGVNTIDVEAASARGIFVCNCPGKNAIAVAELTMGLLCALDRRIAQQTQLLREGRWDKKTFSEANGLYGRTLGLLGAGSIAIEVARRARAFGMRVVVWSRSLTDARAAEVGLERLGSPLDVARSADVVSVHLALGKETRGLCSAEFFAAMHANSFFINTARGEIVDEAALAKAVRERGIAVAADVFAEEPSAGQGAFVWPLAAFPNVIGTHHVGASTDQAQEAIAREAVRIVEAFVRRGEAENCVNLARRSPAACQLVVRHLDRVGVLARVLDVIRKGGINVEEMENVVFEGARAASARIRLGARPAAELLAELAALPEILHAEVTEL